MLLNIPLIRICNVVVHLVSRTVEHDMHVLIAANADAAAFHGAVGLLVSLRLCQPGIRRGLVRVGLVRRSVGAWGGRGACRAAAADPGNVDRVVDAGNDPIVELDSVEEFLCRFTILEGDFGRRGRGLDVGELSDALKKTCQ